MPSYADIRARELKHIEEKIKDDNAYKRQLASLHRTAQDNIRREIDADIQRFATREGLSMTEARKVISKTDVEAYQKHAKRYVEDKDFSPRANREMRRYNVTMRTNRLELLEARINLETVNLAQEEERLLSSRLTDTLKAEYTRQSGILGMSALSQSQVNRMYKSSVLADVGGANFSDRIWQNQNELRNSVNTAIERTLIRGENPRTSRSDIMRNLSQNVKNKRYAADRIAITETARAQTIAARESFIDAGIDKYMWVAELDACEECESLNGQVFELGKFQIGLNAVPKHPNCRCAITPVVDDLEEESNAYDFMELTDDNVDDETRIQEVINRTKEAVEDYKAQTGVDVVELWKNKQFHDKNNTHGDEHAKFTNYLLDRSGYNATPSKLTNVDGLEAMYRGIRDSDDGSIKSKDLIDRFQNGQMDISGARSSTYGRGIYFGDDKLTAESYANKGDNGDIITAYLKKDAKIADYDTIRRGNKIMRDSESTMLEKYGSDVDLYNFASGSSWMMDRNYEVLAILHGYDGISTGGGNHMIINRGALGVKK